MLRECYFDSNNKWPNSLDTTLLFVIYFPAQKLYVKCFYL